MRNVIKLLILLLPNFVNAQDSQTANTLTVGDKVPSIILENFYNKKNYSISTEEFKDRLLILQFFRTNCPGCVEKTKEFHALKEKFGKNLDILLITPETPEKIDKFLMKNPNYFKDLPIMMQDSLMRSKFPYEFISHFVWIYKGTVVAITEGEYITEKNIQLVLNEIKPNWPIKRDVTNFTVHDYMKVNKDNIPFYSRPKTTSYSAWFSNMPSLQVGVRKYRDSINGTKSITMTNLTVAQLYINFYDFTDMPLSHIFINAPEKEYFVLNTKKYYQSGWERLNTYCYEFVAPAKTDDQEIKRKIIADINYYTGCVGLVKDTVVNSLSLVSVSGGKLKLYDKNPDYKYLSIKNLLYNLEKDYFSIPALDKSTIQQDKYLPLEVLNKLSDIDSLNSYLIQYGLMLKKDKAKVRALVINQIDPNRFTHSLVENTK